MIGSLKFETFYAHPSYYLLNTSHDHLAHHFTLPHLSVMKDTLICGDSGGSIFAVGVSLGYDTEELYAMYMRICTNTRNSQHSFYDPGSKVGASVFLSKELWWLLSEPTAFQTLNGNCMVGTTFYENKHVWHKEWRDNIEVFHSVMGSCHIPIYCAPNKRVLGRHVVDGAFSVSGFDLPHGDETLFVGITKNADVFRTLTRTQMLQPPDAKQFADMEQVCHIPPMVYLCLLFIILLILVRRDLSDLPIRPATTQCGLGMVISRRK